MNRSFGRANSKAHHGFTLIELLVVIAIIAILAAILFPVFAQAKLAAKKTAGLAQMKQIGTALFMYEGDHDDGLPTWDWYYTNYPTGAPRDAAWAAAGSPPSNQRMWDFAILPYVKDQSFDKATAVATAEWSGIWRSPGIEYDPKGGRSIGMNQLIFWDITRNEVNTDPDTNVGTGRYRYFNMGEMEAPADTVFVGDSGIAGRIDHMYSFLGWTETWVTPPASGKPSYGRFWRYGKDTANYAFLDGHAKSIKGDKIFPNPGKTAQGTWTTAQRAQVYCASAKYQAGDSASRALLRSTALSSGVTCPE